MVRDTTSAIRFLLGMAVLVMGLGVPAFADAEEAPDLGRPKPHGTEPRARVETRVESRSDGVWIRIEVRDTVPGVSTAPADARPAPHANTQAEPPRSPGSASATVGDTPMSTNRGTSVNAPANPGRSWYDPTRGHFHESPDGHVTHLTPPLIGNASADYWREEGRQRPGQTPWVMFRDDEFIDIIWLPSQTPPEAVQFGTPPAEPAPQEPAPSGSGGVSLDPREVALDTLEHVPFPDIRIRMNPSLGLVAMPGWFWVEGYNGQPFGTSRTVEIPPAVGPEIPVDVVPAADPRRRGSSYTVEVRVWASRYDWTFGDGASLVARSLGRPYPAESDIKHTYEHSSLPFPGGFPVRLTVEYSAEFRVNGGAPQPLPAVRRTHETAHRVQEVQPVLTNR